MKKQKHSRRQFIGKLVNFAGSFGVLGAMQGAVFGSEQRKESREIALSNRYLTVTVDSSDGTNR